MSEEASVFSCCTWQVTLGKLAFDMKFFSYVRSSQLIYIAEVFRSVS
jgi:hypothetical protein